MTIIHAPASPADHPADLVVDVYGTFLGKRSERLVVRWRDAADPVPERPLQGPHTPSPRSAVLRFSKPDLEGETPDNVAPDSEPHPATQAVGNLLNFWRESRLIPDPPNRCRPDLQLGRQLHDLADNPHDGPDAKGWSERLVPLSRLRSVVVSGRGVTISSDLIGALVERGITLSFMSGRGQPVANLSAPGLSGTVQTRRSQLEAYCSPLGVQLAAEFVRGKLRNQKHQLQYSGKYLKLTDPERFTRLEAKIVAIGNVRKQLLKFEAPALDPVRDQLMGYEGTAARLYWEGVAIILEGQVQFPGRHTRGAIDPVNSALNYGYGILYSQVAGALANAGLELYAGFLHVDRPGKPSLVLDVVEEFRAPIVDRAVLALVNQGVPLEADDHGLTAAARKYVADRILDRLATHVPYEGKNWPLSSVMQHQARHLAVAVRGERTYRCFASRW